MRRARPDDIPVLVDLMAEFYAEAGYSLDRPHAANAFASLIADERLGYVWLVQAEGHDVGHIVITLRYAMEYGGLVACLDDLYVQSTWRNKGLAWTAVAEVRDFCQAAGIRAMTVEVGYDNAPAQAVYRRAGFVESVNRQLLAFALSPPSHLTYPHGTPPAE